jgi:site-specific DNA recombinase
MLGSGDDDRGVRRRYGGSTCHALDVTRRAAIYCRLSQDRTGAHIVVERQERDCRDLAERLGWSVVAVYVDNDVSAYRKKPRPGYLRLLAALERGEVNAVLAWHTDRLHRSPKELEHFIDVCEPRDVVTQTHRAGELDLTRAAGRMVARQLGAVARYESEQTAARTKAGKVDAASRGAWSGGQRIYGYDVVKAAERAPGDSALRVRPAEARVVQDAAQRLLAGESLRSIARSLNQAGQVTTTGRPWTGSALRKVLVRPSTAGLRGTGGEVVAVGTWEPLLPEDQWRGVVALLSDPTRRTTERYARRYLGSGLYLCGVCGGGLTGNTTAGGGPGGRRAAYRCRAADRDGSSHVVRDVEHLDTFVANVVIERLSRADAMLALSAPAPDLAPLHDELAGVLARLDEAARGWAAGALTKAQLAVANGLLLARQEELHGLIGQSQQGFVLDGLLGADDAAAAWTDLGLDRQRAVVDLLATVTVLPRQRNGRLPGGGYFDRATVRITWKEQ